jgi:hypothetical protein
VLAHDASHPELNGWFDHLEQERIMLASSNLTDAVTFVINLTSRDHRSAPATRDRIIALGRKWLQYLRCVDFAVADDLVDVGSMSVLLDVESRGEFDRWTALVLVPPTETRRGTPLADQ